MLHEAVEAIAPVIGGCAGALAGQQCGDVGVGRAVGGGVERAIDYFGKRIIERWLEYAPATCRWLDELAASTNSVGR